MRQFLTPIQDGLQLRFPDLFRSTRTVRSVWLPLAVLFLFPFTASAQQIHASSPMQRYGSSFSESIGCNWGLSGRNWSLNVGSPQANNLPRYGNYDMNGGLRTGFQFQRGHTNGYFNGWAGQSYSGFNTLESPSVTFMNGQYASFEHVTETPFVVSTIPVVGTWQGGSYQPYYDPEVTLSPSVLQQRIEHLEQQKAQPRVIREGNAPAMRELPRQQQDAPKKVRSGHSSQASASKTARATSYGSRSGSSAVSRSRNPNTAETPALSVSEMKRRRASQTQD